MSGYECNSASEYPYRLMAILILFSSSSSDGKKRDASPPFRRVSEAGAPTEEEEGASSFEEEENQEKGLRDAIASADTGRRTAEMRKVSEQQKSADNVGNGRREKYRNA